MQKIPEKRIEALEKLVDGGETRNVTIKRADIIADMLNLYSDSNVTGFLLNVHFLIEPALDFDGVKRSVYPILGKSPPDIFRGHKQLRSTNFTRHRRNYVHHIRQNSKSRISFGRGVSTLD